MSEAFNIIVRYFNEFSRGVDTYLVTQPYDPAVCKDAYNRLSRLRDRYVSEKARLGPSERAALAKVFEDDPFIEGMMDARQIGEHVTKRQNDAVIRTISNAPIFLTAESSALAVFDGPIIKLPDTNQTTHTVNHTEQLIEARKRVKAAIDRASNI